VPVSREKSGDLALLTDERCFQVARNRVVEVQLSGLTDVRAKEGLVYGKLTLVRGDDSETWRRIVPRERAGEIATWIRKRFIGAPRKSSSPHEPRSNALHPRTELTLASRHEPVPCQETDVGPPLPPCELD
jgi:hypothetical protein